MSFKKSKKKSLEDVLVSKIFLRLNQKQRSLVEKLRLGNSRKTIVEKSKWQRTMNQEASTLNAKR